MRKQKIESPKKKTRGAAWFHPENLSNKIYEYPKVLGPGDTFGQSQNIEGHRNETAKALSLVCCLSIKQRDFDTISRTANLNQPQFLLNFIETHQDNSFLFPALRTYSLLKFVPLLSEKRFFKGQTISEQGNSNDTLFILKKGQVIVKSKLIYKDYTRHPLDRDKWEVTRKVKTILVTDNQKIDLPGTVFGLSGVISPFRLN